MSEPDSPYGALLLLGIALILPGMISIASELVSSVKQPASNWNTFAIYTSMIGFVITSISLYRVSRRSTDKD
ncbi:hypothetical protein [Geopseudomonas aromaticivorans]